MRIGVVVLVLVGVVLAVGRWHRVSNVKTVVTPSERAKRLSIEELRVAVRRGDAEAIYEVGRRHSEDLKSELVTIAGRSEWSPYKPREPDYELTGSLEWMRRKMEFGPKIAALAVLGKWGDASAESNLCHGFSVMPDLEGLFVPALAFVGSPRTISVISSFKSMRGNGSWRCHWVDSEYSCTWVSNEPQGRMETERGKP